MRSSTWRPITAFLIALAVAFSTVALPALPGQPAFARGGPVLAVDAPAPDQTFTAGQNMLVAGWAADWGAPGPGIDAVEIYLGDPDEGGSFLGLADFGYLRDDVAEAYGNADWANTGFELGWNLSNLAPGERTLYVFAHSRVTGAWTYETRSFQVAPPTAAPPVPGAQPPQTGAPIFPPFEPPFPPAQPGPIGFGSLLNVQADAQGSVSLSWLPRAEASGYRIYRSTTGNVTGFSLIRTISQITGQLISTATIDGLAPGTVYLFQVRAVDPSGQEYLSPTSPGDLPGYAPTVHATANAAGNVLLSWMPSPNTQTYRIYQSTSSAPGSFGLARSVSQSSGALTVDARVAALRPGDDYYFQVRAVDASGQERLVPAFAVGGADVVFPPGVSLGGVSATTASLTWGGSPQAASYRVYQSSTGAAGSFGPAVLSSVTINSGTVTGLLPGATYWFYVTAVNGFGVESAASNLVSATTLAPTPLPGSGILSVP